MGLDEDLDQEEYLEEDEEEDSEEDESDEEENDEKLQTSLPKSGGSIITCCPRLVLPTGSVMPSCQLDQDLPRLPCGHFGVPTRDVGIQGYYFAFLIFFFSRRSSIAILSVTAAAAAAAATAEKTKNNAVLCR